MRSRRAGGFALRLFPGQSVHVEQVLRTVSPRRGIALHASREALRLPGRIVYGAWDPLLWRIDVFGVAAERTDSEISESFLHELAHAHAAVCGAAPDEPRITAQAQAWLARASAEHISAWATELRSRAASREANRGGAGGGELRDIGLSAGQWL